MPLIIYSVLRIALFVVALVGLWLAGMGGWLVVLVAAAIALMLSYLLLGRPRDAASRYMAERVERRKERRSRFSEKLDEDAAAEDAAADALSEDAPTER
ncbi:DUF4229 domain-containing protein [Cellulomonas sp. PhB143]|uniref:DUF4229 domain-containing protein n=1 Tax=Cellulomonas sp. PhB143 TaxID=2485186 RepID=UPI000F497712|nr:DUF4229 domain-containing protein [Cellulomonas sp. PhB143]ROS76693.1 uncharacterized protein DUF4229 [Cellulomonas sp. PhB143]